MGKKKRWSEDEIEYIRQHGPTQRCADIAERLGRSTKSVQHVFNNLGLKKEQAEVGDVVNGWMITEIYEKNIGSQNVNMAKVISTLDESTTHEYRLTYLTKGQVGWPDRRRPDVSIKNKTHGLTNHRLYSIWHGMQNRCSNKNQPAYKHYGARGIQIEWSNFESFYEWSMLNGYEDGLLLDRIDNDKNYSPDNCRWTTAKENTNNRSISINITAFGETKNATDWIDDSRCKCSYGALIYRIHAGWDAERAITKASTKKGDDFRRYKAFYKFVKEKYPHIEYEFTSQ